MFYFVYCLTLILKSELNSGRILIHVPFEYFFWLLCSLFQHLLVSPCVGNIILIRWIITVPTKKHTQEWSVGTKSSKFSGLTQSRRFFASLRNLELIKRCTSCALHGTTVILILTMCRHKWSGKM